MFFQYFFTKKINVDIFYFAYINFTLTFNYNRDDLKDILASDLLKNSDEEKIEQFIANNLSQYDKLLNKEELN